MPGTGRLIDAVDWQDLLEVTARGLLATGLMPPALWTLSKHFTWGVPASEAQWVKNPQPLRLLWGCEFSLGWVQWVKRSCVATGVARIQSLACECVRGVSIKKQKTRFRWTQFSSTALFSSVRELQTPCDVNTDVSGAPLPQLPEWRWRRPWTPVSPGHTCVCAEGRTPRLRLASALRWRRDAPEAPAQVWVPPDSACPGLSRKDPRRRGAGLTLCLFI